MAVYTIDSSGTKYEVDAALKERAHQLMECDKFQHLISHVDLDQVIFLRVNSKKANWLGKCIYIGKAPNNIISKYVVSELSRMGLLNLSNISGFDDNIFDLRYIILINDDTIRMTEDPTRVEDGTIVHEMMHIKAGGEGLVKHDMEDFRDLVQAFGPYWVKGVFSTPEEWVSEESD